MSDANLASIAYRKTGFSGFKALRYTGEDFKNTKETAQSQEIRNDGQVPDLALVGSMPEGGFQFELSFLALQPFLAGALRSNWQTIAIAISATLTLATQTATAAASTFDNVPVGALIKIGGSGTAGNNGLKRVIGKANDGSTLVFLAGSIVADQASAALTFGGKTLLNGVEKIPFDFEKRVVNSAGDDFYLRYLGMVADTAELKIESKRIVTGSFKFIGLTNTLGNSGSDPGAVDPVKASNTLTFSDNATADETVTIGGVVYTFKAVADDEFEVLIGADAEESIDNLVAEIEGLGLSEIHPTVSAAKTSATVLTLTARLSGTGPNAIGTTTDLDDAVFATATLTGGIEQVSGYDETDGGDVLNGTNNMGTILLDGVAATDRFKSISLNIANNLRGKDALGYEGNFDIGLGTIAVTGSLNAYFLDNTLPQKIKAHTSFALSFYLEDNAGNQLHFYLPNVKPSQGDPLITGINTDVMIETSFQAILDRTNGTGKTIIIDAVAAA